MKRLFAILLALALTLTLAACGTAKAPTASGGGSSAAAAESGKTDDKSSAAAVASGSGSVEAMLTSMGLTLAGTKPDEGCFDVTYDDDTLTYFMELSDTKADNGRYIHKIYDACKAASDDGKLYDPNMEFFMEAGGYTELTLPTEAEINGYYFYIAQFGYIKGGHKLTVTVGAGITGYNAARNDDISYPVFTIAVS